MTLKQQCIALLGLMAILGAVVLYVAGCVYLDARVKAACSHGNCRHGWYSKYTKREQFHAQAWSLGVPAGVALLVMRRRLWCALARHLPATATAPCCGRRGSRMVLRTPRRGPYKGQTFWGCPYFPVCRATRQYLPTAEQGRTPRA